MGTSSTGSNSNSSSSGIQTTTPSETGYEQTINPLDVELRQNIQQPLIDTTNSGATTSNNLLQGNSLGGAYGNSIYGVNADDQNAIVNQSMRDVPTSLQQTGMLDSGASQALYQRGAQNVRSQLAQFNTQAQQSALGLGYGGMDQTFQPALSLESMLSQRLQSLRPITTQFMTNSSTANTGTNTGSGIQNLSGLSSAFGSGTGGGNILGSLGGSLGSGTTSGGSGGSSSSGLLGALSSLLSQNNTSSAANVGTTQDSSIFDNDPNYGDYGIGSGSDYAGADY